MCLHIIQVLLCVYVFYLIYENPFIDANEKRNSP